MFFNFFKRKVNYQTGILPDLRSDEEKAKDYTLTEFVTAFAPVAWIKKTVLRCFKQRLQDGSGSCVEQGLEKERGIMAQQTFGEFQEFSAYPYKFRANPSVSGSTKADRIKYANDGSAPEKLVPSMSMTDQQMQNIPVSQYIKEIAKITGCKTVDVPIDIDAVASVIQTTGKGVGVWFRFGPGEWFNRYQVTLDPKSTLPWGHAVCAVDFTLNDAGEKCLVIEDSASEDGFHQRLVPESFFKARCFVAAYLMNFKTYEEKPEKPHFDGSVVSAQDCLKYEDLFPVNVTSTGIIGPVTTKALKMFQIKYDIAPALGNLGPITVQKLYQLYP